MYLSVICNIDYAIIITVLMGNLSHGSLIKPSTSYDVTANEPHLA